MMALMRNRHYCIFQDCLQLKDKNNNKRLQFLRCDSDKLVLKSDIEKMPPHRTL